MSSTASTVADLLLPQALAVELLLEKYAAAGERSVADVRRRVAHALAQAEAPSQRAAWAARFLWAMAQGVIPAGRINHGAGRADGETLISCFVQPLGGEPSLDTALAEASETLRRGGGVGYDFSPLPPNGSLAGLGAEAVIQDGPLAALARFDSASANIGRTGNRRSAQMAVLDIAHPDILDFINAKQAADCLATFNLAVGIRDAFMQARQDNAVFELVHHAQPGPEQLAAGAYRRPDGRWCYRRVAARSIWARLLAAAYASAEPGVLFLDSIQRDNNLAYCETLAATNPCGEQPLPAYGACCLASLNLAALVRDPFRASAHLDWVRMAEIVPLAIRMLDNVLDLSPWPLAQQQAEAMAKRRIGLGLTGLGDALVMLGLRYDSDAGRRLAERIAATLRDRAYAASIELARERGAFPLFEAERYLAGGFASRLPRYLRERLRRHGIRNAHLTSIAPTGTISLALADNVSSGIEPAFAASFRRRRILPDGSQRDYQIEDHACRRYRALGHGAAPPPAFAAALDIAPEQHLRMLASITPYIDAGIAKTINVPADYPFADFAALYVAAWRRGIKGLTCYRANPIRGPVLASDPTSGRCGPPDCGR